MGAGVVVGIGVQGVGVILVLEGGRMRRKSSRTGLVFVLTPSLNIITITGTCTNIVVLVPAFVYSWRSAGV